MNRRTLLRLAVGSGMIWAAGGLLGARPGFASGASGKIIESRMAGGMFYTMDAPGRWAGKEAGHVPMIERSGTMIEVTTGHVMDGYIHYIVKHMILDGDFQFVSERSFDPASDAPVSSHDISGLAGVVYALSMCYVHDVWVSKIEL